MSRLRAKAKADNDPGLLDEWHQESFSRPDV